MQFISFTNVMCMQLDMLMMSCVSLLFCPWERWQNIVMSTSVSLSVCLRAYLRNHTRDLYQYFCACCLWLWLGPRAGWRNPKGNGQLWGLSRPFKSLGNLCCSCHCHFGCKRIIQLPIMSCSRRDHSVCQSSTNRSLENSECSRCGLLVRKGVVGVHSTCEVWYLRLASWCLFLFMLLVKFIF